MTDESETRLERGIKIREKVLGKPYVDRNLRSEWGFDRDFQTLITEYVWGNIWSRPGLTFRERSFLNLAMVSALNRPNQLEVHIKGALNNGITPDEIKEIFIQVSAYCGAPAGIESFRVARKVFEEVGVSV